MICSVQLDAVVIGAGVMGLAVSERLSRQGFRVAVIEMTERTGMGMSGRNSEVIHSGLYYPPGSLKAKHCVRGRGLLYEWCARHHVGHQRIGKLIVASSKAEEEKLQTLKRNADECGVEDVEMYSAEQCARLEPEIRAGAALLVRQSGIVSAHELMDSLSRKLHEQGGNLVFRSKLIGLDYQKKQYVLAIRNHAHETEKISAPCVVNAAGLYADKVASLLGLDVDALQYRQFFCKGNYFRVCGAEGKLSHLVYPLPDEKLTGLGVHATLDLAKAIRLGPDVEWLQEDREDYSVSNERMASFYQAASRYWPSIRNYRLEPAYAGIRAKRSRDGFADFVIAEEGKNGFPGFINLIGMESPGLTAALSIAEEVAGLKK